MLEGIKSMAYNTMVGVGVGAVVGVGCGLSTIASLMCAYAASQELNPNNGKELFENCQMASPVVFAIGFGIAGGVSALVYRISNEMFKKCGIQTYPIPIDYYDWQK